MERKKVVLSYSLLRVKIVRIERQQYSLMAILNVGLGCLLLFAVFLVTSSLEQSCTFIVHMDVSAMPKAFSDCHTWYLATVSSVSYTSEATVTSSSKLLYTCSSSFRGFVARLTNSEHEAMKKSLGYISSTLDRPLMVHTTHSFEFLGLSSVSGAWPSTKYGEDVIIGLVDTGIWPESESFADEGLTRVPSRWKGKCESGTQFNSSSCNSKLIGARFYNKGLLANHPKLTIPMNSPRDTSGHGTHTSSIVAGNYLKGASYFGYGAGTARGIAPRARIAMYKAAWRYGVYSSDVLAAIDQAIEDGVDILSLSLGLSLDDMSLEDDPIAIATFSAMERGIFVAASAGNDGPEHWTLINGAPWLVTVGGGTMDRKFCGVLTLGTGYQITFASLYPGNSSINQQPLVLLDGCGSVPELQKIKNKVIVCRDNLNIRSQVENAETVGVLGAVFITDTSPSETYTRSSFPAAFVGLQDGQIVIDYIQKSSDPRGSFRFQKTFLGTKPAPMVDGYSSRGPFLSFPNILKPDLLAPGTEILASWSPRSPVAEVRSHTLFSKFNLLSGTSMATPHVAGVAALIKESHPDWSPAAIRSALMTTANSLDNTGSPIKDAANDNSPASPLGIGAGHINPTKALDPGLIYDVTREDYVKFLCGMNYSQKQLQTITRSPYNCGNKSADLNYPSFIVYLKSTDGYSNADKMVTREFERTLTNVGRGMSSYTAKVTGMDGIKVNVVPPKLEFTKLHEKLSYKLILEGPELLKEDVVHGSLSWVHDGGKYVVRSPIVATSLVPQSF